jgi:hypothetical protein
MPCGVGAATHFHEQRFPLLPRQTTAIPVRARVLTAVIEKALVVVLRLEGFDFAFDKVIQNEQVVFYLARDIKEKVLGHGRCSPENRCSLDHKQRDAVHSSP